MVVRRGAAAHRQSGLGQALLRDARIAMREQFANLGAVLGGEAGHAISIANVHATFLE